MATADQLRSLARTVGKADFEGSRKLLEHIAERAEARGQARLAEDIYSILMATGRQRESSLKIRDGAIHQDQDARTWITEVDANAYSRRSIVLDTHQETVFESVLLEQRNAKKLRHHNLEPTRRLLLTGPPGTGKSLTAVVLASELALPLRRVNMHTLISRYLGETARNIAQVFEEIQLTRAVYLFDEFDSISRARYAAQESGEMDRVVNAVLQLIENDRSSSLLVATTSAGGHIDHAFARRFDEVVAYGLPNNAAILSLIRLYIPEKLTLLANAVTLFRGLSHADVTNTLRRIHKELLLKDRPLSKRMIEEHVTRYRAAREQIGWNTSDSRGRDTP